MDFKVPIINTSIPPSGSYDPDYLVCGIDSSSGGWVYYNYEDLIWYPIPSLIATFSMTNTTFGTSTSISNSTMYGRLVTSVCVNGVMKVKGFSKPILSGTLTFTDDETTIEFNDIVVVYFQ